MVSERWIFLQQSPGSAPRHKGRRRGTPPWTSPRPGLPAQSSPASHRNRRRRPLSSVWQVEVSRCLLGEPESSPAEATHPRESTLWRFSTRDRKSHHCCPPGSYWPLSLWAVCSHNSCRISPSLCSGCRRVSNQLIESSGSRCNSWVSCWQLAYYPFCLHSHFFIPLKWGIVLLLLLKKKKTIS